MEPILIGISYSDYVPGMKLFLQQDHENLKAGDVVTIAEMNGFNKEDGSFAQQRELFFITEGGVKIVWNAVKVSCCIERNDTTSFIDSMFDYYRKEADKNLADIRNYEWTQRNYDRYLEDKNEVILEMLIEYERRRAKNAL